MFPKDKFFKIYANLPPNLRVEIVAVVEGNPYTWNAVRLEIENDSELGKKILENLIKTGIIK